MEPPNHTRTSRGFELVTFADSCGDACTLQQSSAIGDYPDAMDRPGSSAVWLGIDGEARMHLDRDHVRWLRDTLTHWLDTGSFGPQED